MTAKSAANQKIKVVKENKDMNAISTGANITMNIIFIIWCFLILLPIWIIVVASFTDEQALNLYGYRLWPTKFSIEAYAYLFRKGSVIVTAYKNTIIATICGTLLCLCTVGLYAYPISRKDFRWRKFFTFLSFFTMLFSAGTVASYVTNRQILGLANNIFCLFLPLSFSAYWVIVMRTFYQSNVPEAVIESARIDGAGEWRTLIQIVLPLAIPGLATVSLFAAIGIWNNFFQCLLLVDDAKYYNLQYTIYQTLVSIRFLKEMAAQVGNLSANIANLPDETFRMAMAVVTVGPIILAYPFFQKYFVKGLTIGAVKG